MIGKVRTTNFGYAFIRCEDRNIFCHATQMPVDELGRKYLVPGEAVTFEIGKGPKGPMAVNVQLATPREKPDLLGYFEEGAVSKTTAHGYAAFVLRPFGGAAFLHWENVKHCFTKKENGHVWFYPGQRWRFEIASPIGTRADEPWLAKYAVELEGDGHDSDAQGV
jgi:cold shock CspA family protein